VDALAAVKAVAPHVVTTVSAEPLLGSLVACPRPLDLSAVDWVITGAESGLMPDGKQRVMQEAWVRELRDLCLARTPPVPFFYKQKATPKGGKVEAPELDGRQWLEWPTLYSVRGSA
jgi:protein gp37